MSLESYIQAMPKVELHLHLEGAIQPSTVLELALRNHIDLPFQDENALRKSFAYRDFDHFIETFLMITSCLKTVEDYELIVYQLGAELARQNVRYAEVTVTPSTHRRFGIPTDTWFSGLQRGRSRVQADFGLTMNWIYNIVRKWADSTLTEPMADYVTRVAIEGKNDGVVALGLAGSEAGAPPEPFARWFEQARAEGLHSVPHAGEMAGPESIWGAIHTLGAERIAHGVRAIEDPDLVEYLVDQRIPLDITPTSNIQLGVYPDYTAHPFPRLYGAGAIVTLSTDDPPLFNTTLNDEFALLATAFGLNLDAIDQIALNGVRASFPPEIQKREMETTFREQYARLKTLH
ncbi:MAG TPA: adenosine deaminase [Ktedonobacteraceae bacterium]|nr:adenosine deaminase [Ktedonobacteraceae bacterium]